MPTFVIKNLSIHLYKRLKEKARKVRHSVMEEVIRLLEAGLRKKRSISLTRVLPLPYEGKKPLTDKLIQQWKRKGMA